LRQKTPQLFIAHFSTIFLHPMKQTPTNSNNQIWYNFFIRSANDFIFDLLDNGKDLKQFSTEQIYNMVAVCDNVANKAKVFKGELERRVGK
jgi:hypothetical protein